MKASKALIRLALVGLVGAVVWAVVPATADSATELHLHSEADGTTYFTDDSPTADQAVQQGQGCELDLSVEQNLVALTPFSLNTKAGGADVGFIEGLGTKSGGSNGTPCSQVEESDDEHLTLTATNGYWWLGAELDLELKQSAWVLVTLSGGEATELPLEDRQYQLITGASIADAIAEGLDVGTPDQTFPYQASVGSGTTVSSCANPSDSGPDSGPNDNCRLSIAPGFAFTSITLDVKVGSVSLEGGIDFYGGFFDERQNREVPDPGEDYDSVFFYAPKAQGTADSYVAYEDSAFNSSDKEPVGGRNGSSVLDNDSKDLGLLRAVLVDDVTVGDLTLGDDGHFTYAPEENFFGSVTFTYYATPLSGGTPSSPITVTIDVTEVNDGPVLNDGASNTSITEGQTLELCASDYATDPDNTDGLPGNEDILLIQGSADKGSTGPSGSSGCVTYEPPSSDFFGEDTVSGTISDGDGGSVPFSVTVTVVEVNDDPTAADDGPVTVNENRTYVITNSDGSSSTGTTSFAVTIDVLANDSDPDIDDGLDGNDDTLTVSSVATPTYGTATVTNSGTLIVYVPDLDASNSGMIIGDGPEDTFEYTIHDGRGGFSTATVSVNIEEVMCQTETRHSRANNVYGAFTLVDYNGCKNYSIQSYEDPERVEFVPFGGSDPASVAYFTGVIEFSSQDVALGSLIDNAADDNTLSLLEYDPDGAGETFKAMPVCENPEFDFVIEAEDGASMVLGVVNATIPTGDTWCLAMVTASADASGELQPAYIVYGEGDPLFRAR